MSEPERKYVKILFDIELDDKEIDIESMWAVSEHGDNYRIDNIPFYVRGFACGDVISAAPDPGGALRCTGLVTPSGHSTIRLWFADAKDVPAVRDELRAMNCRSELDLARLVAVNVPPGVPYEQIREFLDQKERQGIFENEEGCLGQ